MIYSHFAGFFIIVGIIGFVYAILFCHDILEDEFQVFGMFGLGVFVFSAIIVFITLFGMEIKMRKDPLEKTLEVVETYLPSDETFQQCHLIDKGVYQIQTKEWSLEIPENDCEFCDGESKVELCKETKVYRIFGFLFNIVEKDYYRVYIQKK